MLNPWNNAVALEHKAAHSHEIAVVSSVGSVNACFQQSSSSVGSERIEEDVCNMCERMSCWVRAILVCASSLPFCISPFSLSFYHLFHHLIIIFSSLIFLYLYFLFIFRKTHILCWLSHSCKHTHPHSLSPHFSVFFFPHLLLFLFLSSVNYTDV